MPSPQDCRAAEGAIEGHNEGRAWDELAGAQASGRERGQVAALK